MTIFLLLGRSALNELFNILTERDIHMNCTQNNPVIEIIKEIFDNDKK